MTAMLTLDDVITKVKSAPIDDKMRVLEELIPQMSEDDQAMAAGDLTEMVALEVAFEQDLRI